ncbi:uncharacterized protein B0I36DRAFT_392813 [Microdochium trichocladiopsis]|uniref:ABM domain-containing protein n=1 Tax=Microdochium trichocladiopsis TaxID=1682393 RepID=A0A9P9BJZ6_9PEZI|nr:uncharacterized protein B0I36DRAFT_392813 [Microdochium trichocladiopsis]KAH7020714.1 hypothetical protein B0I36DRAFT_392813 [Microdochium trichocladiopsis]
MSEVTPEQMAVYTEALLKHTKVLDQPVTEIVIFKLKQPHSDETTRDFETRILANAATGEGVRRMSWGYSLDDSSTMIWQIDWARIQDHWTFWQTPAFLPVIRGISDLFEAGRPLVRHYHFKPAGMLHEEVQLISVWDQGAPGQAEADVLAGLGHSPDGSGDSKSAKGAYAVDMQGQTWYCAAFGFATEEEARASSVTRRGESHLVKLKVFDGAVSA